LINTSKDSIVLIIEGVSCYDALMRCEFILHAHIIAWTGDIPALSKIMNITGHNSYSGCRFVIFEEFIRKNIDMFIFPLN